MGPLAVYLAGSSAELARAARWRTQLLAAGIDVVSTWIESVETAGCGNPLDIGRDARRAIALGCLRELRHADALWLLVPGVDAPSCGAWCEFGVADAEQLAIVSSGDTHRSVFCALGGEYAKDEDAFAALVEMSIERSFLRHRPCT